MFLSKEGVFFVGEMWKFKFSGMRKFYPVLVSY